MQKLGKEAGQALERAAQIQADKINEPDDAANTWQEAFKAYRKTDPQDAARVLQFAINHYTSKVSLLEKFGSLVGLHNLPVGQLPESCNTATKSG